MRKLLIFLLCSTWMIGQSKISDNQIRTPPPLQCSDTTTSGTTQTCTTTPSFTPAAKDCVTYNTTTTNTGALTLNVNSQGAKPVQKWLGTALVAGDVVANKPQLACYDGTNWQLMTIGNAPTGTVTSVTCNAGLTGGAITASGTCALATSGTSATGMILLEKHTASTSASLDFTTCISSTYNNYYIVTSNLYTSASVNLWLQFSVNGGSTWDTSSTYGYAKNYNRIGTADSGTQTSTTTNGYDLSGGGGMAATSTNPFVATMTMYSPLSAANWKYATGQTIGTYSGSIYLGNYGFEYQNANAVNAFRIIPSSGTITAGDIRCYGMTQ